MLAPRLGSFLLLLIFLFLCFGAVRILLRFIFPKESSGAVRITAVGITLVLWSNSIRTTLDAIYKLFRQIFIFPFSIDAENALKTLQQGGSIFRALNSLLPNADSLLQELDRIPAFQLLLALVVLMLLVRLLSSLSVGTTPQWVAPLRGIRSNVWLNTLVLCIFFAGIYLSVASLCTIPALQINQPFTDAERSQINTQIDAYTPTDEAFKKQFPESPLDTDDEVSQLRKLLFGATGDKRDPGCPSQEKPDVKAAPAMTANGSTTAGVITGTGKPPTSSAGAPDPKVEALRANQVMLAQVTQLVETYDSERCKRLDAYQNLRTGVQQAEHASADKIKSQITSNFALRLTGRDRADYTYTLEADHQDTVSQLQAALSRCRSEVQSSDPALSSYVQMIEVSLQVASTNHDNGGAVGQSFFPVLPTDSFSADSCDFDPTSLQGRYGAPAPQLGIFSFFFGWLEDSDSLALSIISGMLGVGLVGCIVSSFVRQQVTRKPGEPWIVDPFPVIVRGFTAAIVVYLAIEGGLNIFSAASSQANPYVLLFSCLVGSVFSEDVWVAAHKRLESADSKVSSAEKRPTEAAPVDRGVDQRPPPKT